MKNKLNEACGIFANYSFGDERTYIKDNVENLKQLSHRGQNGWGFVFDNNFKDIYGVDSIVDFSLESDIKSNRFLGHVRYSTSKHNANGLQPILLEPNIYVTHNGNLTNTKEILISLNKGDISLDSDSEIIKHLWQSYKEKNIKARVINVLKTIEGAYSLVFMASNALYAARDKNGFKPLEYIATNENCIVTSENRFPNKESKTIEPGEMLVIENDKISTERILPLSINKFCLFEYLYFCRDSSHVNGYLVKNIRSKIGKTMAFKVKSNEYDYVVPIPNSGYEYARTISKENNIELFTAIELNVNHERTFIENIESSRKLKTVKKYILNKDIGLIKNKSILIVDDSIVRGNTLKHILKSIEVYSPARIDIILASPKIINVCKWGVDIKSKDELIMNKYTSNELARKWFVNNVYFSTINEILKTCNSGSCSFCFRKGN